MVRGKHDREAVQVPALATVLAVGVDQLLGERRIAEVLRAREAFNFSGGFDAARRNTQLLCMTAWAFAQPLTHYPDRRADASGNGGMQSVVRHDQTAGGAPGWSRYFMVQPCWSAACVKRPS